MIFSHLYSFLKVEDSSKTEYQEKIKELSLIVNNLISQQNQLQPEVRQKLQQSNLIIQSQEQSRNKLQSQIIIQQDIQQVTQLIAELNIIQTELTNMFKTYQKPNQVEKFQVHLKCTLHYSNCNDEIKKQLKTHYHKVQDISNQEVYEELIKFNRNDIQPLQQIQFFGARIFCINQNLHFSIVVANKNNVEGDNFVLCKFENEEDDYNHNYFQIFIKHYSTNPIIIEKEAQKIVLTQYQALRLQQGCKITILNGLSMKVRNLVIMKHFRQK